MKILIYYDTAFSYIMTFQYHNIWHNVVTIYDNKVKYIMIMRQRQTKEIRTVLPRNTGAGR